MLCTYSQVGLAALAVSLAVGAPSHASAQTLPDAGQAASASQALAAQEGESGIGDIVVTAQRRSESLQKVPLAVTAVTAVELERSGVRDLQGVVAFVPNLNLGQQLGVAKIALRGIGLENIAAGAEGSIAFHLDGVFVSRSIAALSSFYDVQQVEVLRGPQGTLYGRNATGGSINITTRGPTQDLSGYINVTAGNYGRIVTEGAIGGPLVPDVLAARIAFQTQDRDGFGKNVVTGKDIDNLKTRAVRGSLLFTPSDRLSVDIKGDYFREKDRAGGYHYFGPAGFSAPGVPIVPFGLAAGGAVASNIRDISNDIDPRNSVEFWGVSGKVTYDLGGDTEFRSLTAYRRTKYTTLTDLDSTSAALTPVTQFERAKQFSQELQLAGRGDRYTWLAGFFYFNENDAGGQPIPFNNFIVGFPLPGTFVQGYYAGGRIKTDAIAVFGQASYEVVDNLRVTLGARYSTEKKNGHDDFMFDFLTPYDPNLPLTFISQDQSKRFKSFTPRVALDYQMTPDVLLYASWSKGFKAGTYNLGGLQGPVSPEKVSAFEGGIKSSLFDRRVRINLAGFYYDYKDLQVGKVIVGSLRLENAATAKIYGLEAELQVKVTPQFEINANASWLHARFDQYVSADPSRPFGDGVTFVDADGNLIPNATASTPGATPAFNLAGNSLSQSPDFTFFVGAQYEIPTDIGSFTLRSELSWRDRVYFTPFNVDYVSQPSFAKVNAFINWQSRNENMTASLFVKNLANETTIGNSYISSALVGFPINGYLEEPRTYGITVGYKF